MRRHAKAPSAGTNLGAGTSRARKSLFGMACLCVVALTAFLGSGAPSAGAAGCPNEEFRTGVGAFLPDCRAYEQVSPVDKNGGDILWNTGGIGQGRIGAQTVAADGERAIIVSFGEFADIAFGAGTGENKYLSRRTATGWRTVSMLPRAPSGNGNIATSVPLSSRDLALSLVESEDLLTSDPLPPAPGSEPPISPDFFYLRDNVSNLLSPSFNTPLTQGFLFPIATPGFEHIVFGSWAKFTNDPGMPEGFEITKVFELVGGQFRLVSVKPDGTPFQIDAFPAGGGTQDPDSTAGGISEDGEHIFFSTVQFGFREEIYRRSHGTTTLHVSASKRTPADPSGAKEKLYRFATPDGNRVLFTSAELLTDDANTGPSRAGRDLYRYDAEADELIDISATTPDGGNGADVRGVVGSDENAERVYYVGFGQVLPGQGTAGQPNLYLWEDDGTADGQTRFIATLSSEDEPMWRNWRGDKTARTSVDGRSLLFQSASAAIPGADNSGPECVPVFAFGKPTGEYSPGTCSQLYRYDAEANGGAGELECVSCNPEGDTPIGPSIITPHNWGSPALWELPRNLTDDGQTVFFTSRDDLLPTDTNGRFDAYMWRDGELHLLSSGTSSDHSYFYSASSDGKDAFILTRERLVPQDGDGLLDLYTAHVNGGFAAQFATLPPSCAGEECRGAGTQEGIGPAPTTSTFQGQGNPKPKRPRCGKGKRRVKARNGKSRCVKRKQGNRANRNRRAGR